MKSSTLSSAELFVATGCRHCPVVLNELAEQLKKGEIASLNVINIALDNKKAEQLNIRSVPWFSLKNEHCFMIFSGNHSPKEIQKWVASSKSDHAMQDYIEEFLSSGQLMTLVQTVKIEPGIFSHVVDMIADEDTSMEIRIGLDALIEQFSATETLRQHVDSFKKIASTNDVRLTIDALHYIALTADTNNLEFLQDKTSDNNEQIQEAASEAIETLNDLLTA